MIKHELTVLSCLIMLCERGSRDNSQVDIRARNINDKRLPDFPIDFFCPFLILNNIQEMIEYIFNVKQIRHFQLQ